MSELITGPWYLEEYHRRKGSNGLTFLSTFSGGGGSSMGWGLAGYEPVGAVEIDPKMAECYRKNLGGTVFVEGVQDFAARDLADMRGELDVLDGSPPCSVFSAAGHREKKWGTKHKFAEGQAVQVLDDLFFQWIDIVDKLQPKVAVAENVKGLIQGNAKGYVLEISNALNAAGYQVQLFLLNAARMGVPQRRERVFFVARRADLQWQDLVLEFDAPEIPIAVALEGANENGLQLTGVQRQRWEQTKPGRLLVEGSVFAGRRAAADKPASTQTATAPLLHWEKPRMLSSEHAKFWALCKPGQELREVHPKKHLWSYTRTDPKKPSCTLDATTPPIRWNEPRLFATAECVRVQTFPDDYDFCQKKGHYVCGMSVPPFMMQRLALQIYEQWFSG